MDFEDLIPDKIPIKPLRFELILNSIKVKGLSSDYVFKYYLIQYYFIELNIPNKSSIIVEYTPITGGPNPIFDYKVKHVIEIDYNELKTTYFKIVRQNQTF